MTIECGCTSSDRDNRHDHHDRQTGQRDPAEVCTLSEAELSDRLAWVTREILPAAISRETGHSEITWTLRDSHELADQLDRLIELEAECCDGIGFEHTGDGTTRRFVISGIDPAASVFQRAENERRSNRWGLRLLRAAGLGAGTSVLVCCLLPLGVAALLGAAAAAPFATLDEPWIIALAAVATGSLFYLKTPSRRVRRG